MRTAVVLIGPPGAGKSTIAREVARMDPSFEVVDLDDIRKRIFERERGISFTTKMESEAQEVALDLIKISNRVVFPSLGVSKFFEKALQWIEVEFDCVVPLKVECPNEEIYARLMERRRKEPFRPHPFNKSEAELVNLARSLNRHRKWREIDGTLPVWKNAKPIVSQFGF